MKKYILLVVFVLGLAGSLVGQAPDSSVVNAAADQFLQNCDSAQSAGKYKEGLLLADSVLNLLNKANLNQGPRFLKALNLKCTFLYEQGNYPEAEAVGLKAKSLAETVFGKSHQEYAGCLNNLGIVYYYQSRYDRVDTLKMRLRTRECLGDPNRIGPRGEGVPGPLPNTRSEADTVAARLREAGAQVEIRMGYEPLEEDVRQIGTEEASPDLLMFATHGFGSDSLPIAFRGRFPANNPMYSSWLLLAGSEQVDSGGVSMSGFQDGILTAREISDLNLQGTRLAILSACKSGLGAAQSNEGVYGLQRAFKIAGAQQVLVTLWEIPDSRETQEFVGQFCERWLKSGDARKALRETQLNFYERGKSVQVWGAWVLI